jgi:hypothetical protein
MYIYTHTHLCESNLKLYKKVTSEKSCYCPDPLLPPIPLANCYGAEMMFLPNSYIEVLTLSVTVFGDRAFKEIIKNSKGHKI